MCLTRKELITYKKTLVLSNIQREGLVGTLLGDVTIVSLRGKAKHNVKLEQKLAKNEYINHLYSIFSEWVGTPPVIRNISGGGANDTQSVWFRTYRHLAFTEYRRAFIIGGYFAH